MSTIRLSYTYALVGALLLATGPVPAEEAASTSTVAAEAEAGPVREADALALLQRMASFLASTPRFSVDIVSVYDTVQTDGQKIEFGEARTVTVNRPGQLHIDSEMSDGDRRTIYFDGSTLTVASTAPDTDQMVYAQTPQPGSLDESVRFFKTGLRLRFPLAVLWLNSLPEELESRLVEIVGVESSAHRGVVLHHIATRGQTVDIQFWIAGGEQPFLHRIVVTYRNAEGQPQYRADFSNWNLNPVIDDKTFTFEPPADATRIAFLTQITLAAPPVASGDQQ